MVPRIASIDRMFSRIREIETRVNPNVEAMRRKDEPRFQDVLEEVQRDMPSMGRGSGYTGTQPVIPLSERMNKWEPVLQELCERYDLDANLARAVMRCESGGQEQVVSRAGAMGLMQLMPGTAKALGVDPKDPARNLEGGIKYLAQLADRYDGDLEKTLAAYNAGPGRVDSYGGIPPFTETQNYVKNVLALYRRYARGDE